MGLSARAWKRFPEVWLPRSHEEWPYPVLAALGCSPQITLGLHADPQFGAGAQGIGQLQRHVS